MRAIRIAIFSWLACSTAFSQGIILHFSHDKSTWLWEDSLWIDQRISDRFHLLLNNRSSATLIEKSLFMDNNDRWQKGALTNFSLTHLCGKQFSWGVTSYNDYSRLEDRRVTMNRIGLHQTYQPLLGLTLSGLVSYSESSRRLDGQRNLDQGFLQIAKIDYAGRLIARGDFRAGYFHELNLLKRTPEKSLGLMLGYTKSGGHNRVAMNYSGNYQNKKYFSSLSSFANTASQDKIEHAGDLAIAVQPWSHLRLDLLSDYSYRRYDYTQPEGLPSGEVLGRDNLTATFNYRLGSEYDLAERAAMRVEYQYRHSDEEFGGFRGGQLISLGELRLTANLRLSARDSLQALSTFSVTRFSGKQDDNLFSDRDRAFRMTQGTYQHQFSPHFLLRLRGSYQYTHNTYISGDLSANNNHDIIYLFQPEAIWIPCRQVQISQGAVMHANYIYYDYEKYENSPRNTIYRKADYLTRIAWTFSDRLSFLVTYRYRYEDFGQLIYRDQWSQRISWERKGHLPSFELEWRPWQELRINPGYSYERKHAFDHQAGAVEGQEILREKELFRRERIFLNVDYSAGEKSAIQLNYTRRVQKSLQFADDESDIITLSVRRYF